jgi:hypothetical protein
MQGGTSGRSLPPGERTGPHQSPLRAGRRNRGGGSSTPPPLSQTVGDRTLPSLTCRSRGHQGTSNRGPGDLRFHRLGQAAWLPEARFGFAPRFLASPRGPPGRGLWPDACRALLRTSKQEAPSWPPSYRPYPRRATAALGDPRGSHLIHRGSPASVKARPVCLAPCSLPEHQGPPKPATVAGPPSSVPEPPCCPPVCWANGAGSFAGGSPGRLRLTSRQHPPSGRPRHPRSRTARPLL